MNTPLVLTRLMTFWVCFKAINLPDKPDELITGSKNIPSVSLATLVATVGLANVDRSAASLALLRGKLPLIESSNAARVAAALFTGTVSNTPSLLALVSVKTSKFKPAGVGSWSNTTLFVLL